MYIVYIYIYAPLRVVVTCLATLLLLHTNQDKAVVVKSRRNCGAIVTVVCFRRRKPNTWMTTFGAELEASRAYCMPATPREKGPGLRV